MVKSSNKNCKKFIKISIKAKSNKKARKTLLEIYNRNYRTPRIASYMNILIICNKLSFFLINCINFLYSFTTGFALQHLLVNIAL